MSQDFTRDRMFEGFSLPVDGEAVARFGAGRLTPIQIEGRAIDFHDIPIRHAGKNTGAIQNAKCDTQNNETSSFFYGRHIVLIQSCSRSACPRNLPGYVSEIARSRSLPLRKLSKNAAKAKLLPCFNIKETTLSTCW